MIRGDRKWVHGVIISPSQALLPYGFLVVVYAGSGMNRASSDMTKVLLNFAYYYTAESHLLWFLYHRKEPNKVVSFRDPKLAAQPGKVYHEAQELSIAIFALTAPLSKLWMMKVLFLVCYGLMNFYEGKLVSVCETCMCYHVLGFYDSSNGLFDKTSYHRWSSARLIFFNTAPFPWFCLQAKVSSRVGNFRLWLV